MIELLGMCGFEPDEAKSELPRMERAFKKVGITTEDIEQAKQRLNLYYDMELKGVRKIFRLCIHEMTNSILAREEGKSKVVFGFMSPGLEVLGSALMSKSRDVFFAHQSWAIMAILGCVFGKFVPILEAAETLWLKSGVVSHCANVKSLLGLITLDILPKPDLLLTTGFSCETAPKTIDLLHELYDIPVCCYDTCQDREFADYSVSSIRTVGLAAKSLRSAAKRIGKTAGFGITDEMIFKALKTKHPFNVALEKLFGLIEKSDPMPISSTHQTLFMVLASLTMSIEKLPEAVDAVNTLHEELQVRIDKGQGSVPKGAPRVLAILPCHHSDPRLEHLAGEMGIALISTDIGFELPFPQKPKDSYEMSSLHLQQSLATSLSGRIQLIVKGCRDLKIDGVLNRYHVGCRAVAGDSLIITDRVSKELGIPALLLEWENFDPRAYNQEEYRKHLELFKILMQNSKSKYPGSASGL
ncbi:2-hydroxyacyl-CoA dehydratase [Thermodesulfobacteriota bacterium]